MARKGENIYKRKDGRWEARYIREHTPDGKTRYGYCYAATYNEVKKKLFAAKMDQFSGKEPGTADPGKRFRVCCGEWLRMIRMKVKDSTYVKYSTVLERHILPELGDFPVGKLSAPVIADFSRTLLYEEGLSPKTVKDTLVLLKSILTYTGSSEPGCLPQIDIVYPKTVNKQVRVLSREEQQRLTDFLLTETDNVRFGVLLTLMTGLRVGEICALRWEDISLTEKAILVRSTMQRIRNLDEKGKTKTRILITDPKSGSSVRMIPLTDNAVRLCRKFRAQSPEAFVLTGSAESFMEPRALQYHLKQFTKACGLEGVHYHTLRHSFATRCVEVDFEIKSLSEILGHSNPRITLDRYVHTSMDLKRSNMKKLAMLGF